MSFDHGAALDGIAGCDAAARALDEAGTRLTSAVAAVVEDWVGPHRRNFDDLSARLRGALDDARREVIDVGVRLREADAQALASEQAAEASLRRGPF
ncbi:MAG: hypothetical protein ACR2LQ_06400 [Acidimicrobiales bacterium]